MKTSKANRIFTLIWIIIGLSSLKPIYTLITSGLSYHRNPFTFWLAFLNLFTAMILLIMSFNMRRIIGEYTQNNNWQATSYHKMKVMGYWAILLVLIHTFFQIGYDCIWVLIAKKPVTIDQAYLFRRFCAIILTESPAFWVLALSIFLLAELLKVTNQVKAENEAFI